VVEERRLRIPGSLEKVRVACDFVVETARRAGLGDRAVYHCQLAVDEACTNIIEHGYGMNGANQVIDVICRQEADRFVITVIDDSAPFNPLTIKEPDPSMLLEDRKEGGWGIFFIKKVMDEVSYQQQGNRNRLMMVKNLGK
jgi:anti-sigma regulatory factor (Ser/Thr protein kinase)